MVTAQDNRAEIAGSVSSIASVEVTPGYRVVSVDVLRVSTVDAFPNMFTQAAGTRLEVRMRTAEAETLTPGADVRLHITRKGPTQIYGNLCA